MTDQRPLVRLECTPEVVRLLHASVSQYLERWPGGPAEEQERLQGMITILNAAVLECLLDLDVEA